MFDNLSPRRASLVAALIILFTTLVRIWFVASGQLELVQDEAQYWDWIRHPQLSYYSKGPLVAWIISLGTSLFGHTELGVRFGAIAGSLAIQVLGWLFLSRMVRRPGLGLWTLVILNTMPLFLASGLLMTTDNPLMICWTVALISLYAATRKDGTSGWALPVLAMAVALGILAKYMMLAFALVAVVHLFFLARAGLVERRVVLGVIGAVALGTIIGFLPILIWNMQNDFVGFRHVSALAGVEGAEGQPLLRLATLPEFLGSQLGLVTPWWLAFMIVGGVRSILRSWRRQDTDREQGDSFVRESLYASAFWPIFAGFTLLSLHKQVYPNWPAVCYAGGVFLAAREMEGLWSARRAVQPTRWARWAVAWPVLGLLAFVATHAMAWAPLPEDINPTVRLRGWSDLGGEVSRMAREDFSDPGKVFFFSDEYDITAALAFYVDGRPRSYCALHDRRMSQYDLWPGPQDKIGWDAIYVRKRFKDMNPDLASMFARVENIPYQSTLRGRPGMRFTITRCYDFQGPWPSVSGDSY